MTLEQIIFYYLIALLVSNLIYYFNRWRKRVISELVEKELSKYD